MESLNRPIRLLYVGFTEIGDNDATGNTLNNIFGDWKDVDILQYSLDYSSENHSGIGEKFYVSKIGSPTYYLIKSFYRRKARSSKNNVVDHSSSMQNSRASLGKAILDILPKRLSIKNYNRIKNFKPDYIYTLAENISTLRTVNWLSNRLNVPTIVHIMDDYESTIYTNGLGHACFRNIYNKLLKKTYSKVAFGIAIGDKMAEEYTRRHNKKFVVAMNCINRVHQNNYATNSPLRLIFSGGLHGGRAQSLSKIENIIDSNAILKKELSLEIYTSADCIKKYGNLFGHFAKLYEYVPREEYFNNLMHADILLHVESFDKNEIQYFKYSMSTKIPEYLSVGRPIFCYGPKEVSTAEFIEKNQVGIVATDVSEIEEVLADYVNDETLRKNLSDHSSTIANQFLKSAVRELLMNDFITGING